MRVGKSHVRMDRKLLGDIESVETQYRWKELGVYDFSEQWKSKDWSRRLDSVPKEQRSLHFLTIVGRSRDPSLTGSRRPPLCVRKEGKVKIIRQFNIIILMNENKINK